MRERERERERGREGERERVYLYICIYLPRCIYEHAPEERSCTLSIYLNICIYLPIYIYIRMDLKSGLALVDFVDFDPRIS